MPMRCCLGVALLLILSSAGVAKAQDGWLRLAISGGTLGIGPEIDYRSDRFGIRLQASLLDIGHDFEAGGIDYEGDVKLRSGGAMLDIYPFEKGWRISAGARVNGNRADIRATPRGPIDIGDMTVGPSQTGTLLGKLRVREVAPAVTIGYGGSPKPGLSFGVEAGALFQGAPRVKMLRSEGGSLSNDPGFQAQLAQERVEIENDLDDYRLYPIVQVSLGYRF